jgi:hypothetical protein
MPDYTINLPVAVFHKLRTIPEKLLMVKGQNEFEDTKGVIRIRISKKNRQHNGEKKKDEHRSTKHTHKTKDRVYRGPLTGK